ncbi:MAG: alpha/beta hydrolase [Chitinophagales bacterium]|nr:alpha/beta hydrolase [Chitinophagales bacterium]
MNVVKCLFFSLLLVACVQKHPTEEVAFKNGDITLSGTIYYPTTTPLKGSILLLTGKGPFSRQDLDITPFVEMFNRHGLAVLLYDKRGCGKSDGNLGIATFFDVAQDALQAVGKLKKNKRLSELPIGIWGGSEGANIAVYIADKDTSVHFLVAQSFAAVPFREQNLFEVAQIAKKKHLSDEDTKLVIAFQTALLDFSEGKITWEAYLHQWNLIKDKPYGKKMGIETREDPRWIRYKSLAGYHPLNDTMHLPTKTLFYWGEKDDFMDAPTCKMTVDSVFKHNYPTYIIEGSGHNPLKPGDPNAKSNLALLEKWLENNGF